MKWISSLFLTGYSQTTERPSSTHNNLKHENEAEEPWLFSLVFVFKIISTFIGQNPKFFFKHVLKKDVLLV